jgi:hypothetical protein
MHGMNNIKSTIYTVVFCCSFLTWVNIHMHSYLNCEMILIGIKQWFFLQCKLAPLTTQLKKMYNIKQLFQQHYCGLLLMM